MRTDARRGCPPGTTAPAVLVTGASGGIGGAVCQVFAEAGWFVGVHYRQNKSAAEATLHKVRGVGAAGELYQADIREADSVQRMVDTFSGHVADTLVCVCNAGMGGSGLLLRQNDEALAEVLGTNLTGTFHCLRAIAPVMLARAGGSIIVIGSHAGFHGTAGQAAYAASKAGLIGLVKTAAQEWGAYNIRVNLLLPGWHKTGLSESAIPSDHWTDHALRRPPSLDDVARTILHLAQLQDVSGQVWNCDSRHL